ncbi:MAG: N-acetylmuramoyl-L-alanine amidase [Clostridiaceae bacterium]
MRIAFRYGHNPLCPGASSLVDEVTEDRKYGARVIQLLQEVGNQCFDCTPPPMANSGAELAYGTNKENAINPICDLFIPFHVNAASAAAHGAETLISSPSSTRALTVSNRILSNLSKLGISNRGVKATGDEFNDIRESRAEAIILEPFFLTNINDVNIYKNNFEGFCRAIANGIDNRVSLTVPVQSKSTGLTDMVCIDNPKNNHETSNTFELNGWALSSVDRIELLLNGASCGVQILTVERPDVLKAYPQYKKSKVGFRWGIDIKSLKMGVNTLTVWSGNASKTINVIRK